MRHHCVVFPTAHGGCHTLWVLGHLAYIEKLVTCSIMLGEPNPLAHWEAPGARVPAGFEQTFGTYRRCVQYVADHWYMHRGHLADSRRAAGLERMWV